VGTAALGSNPLRTRHGRGKDIQGQPCNTRLAGIRVGWRGIGKVAKERTLKHEVTLMETRFLPAEFVIGADGPTDVAQSPNGHTFAKLLQAFPPKRVRECSLKLLPSAEEREPIAFFVTARNDKETPGAYDDGLARMRHRIEERPHDVGSPTPAGYAS
jgi:hypothetical protein